jgi:hypothetical protein
MNRKYSGNPREITWKPEKDGINSGGAAVDRKIMADDFYNCGPGKGNKSFTAILPIPSNSMKIF